MRLHTATAALGLSALAILALSGCSNGTATTPVSSAAPSALTDGKAASSAPLSSAALSRRLLVDSDLGAGYTRKPESTQRHDDVIVIGCPALEKLGGDAVTGGSLGFPRKAKATFSYSGSSDSEVSEELYSDTAAVLSSKMGRIFDAMASCPTYQVTVGSTPIDIGTQKTTTSKLGDQQWSQLLNLLRRGAAQHRQADGHPHRQHPGARVRLTRPRGLPPRQGPHQSRRNPLTHSPMPRRPCGPERGIGVPEETPKRPGTHSEGGASTGPTLMYGRRVDTGERGAARHHSRLGRTSLIDRPDASKTVSSLSAGDGYEALNAACGVVNYVARW